MKFRLSLLSFLEFGVWGAYLISMGTYLVGAGMGAQIGYFYAMQGVTALFMPALMGMVADRWIPAEKMLSLCHFMSALAKIAMGYIGLTTGGEAFGTLITLYTLAIGFFMPTLALSNSVAYTALEKTGKDPIKAFPSIRFWGTVGFICTMLITDLMGFQADSRQFYLSGTIGIITAIYALTLPTCPVNNTRKSMADAWGLRAFSLFKQRRMAIFFLFSGLLGICLQITNGYANPFLSSFKSIPEYAGTFGVQHANALISLSQMSETFCILLIPFALRKWGIKRVMLIAMLCWALRFALFGWGNPGNGVWMFVLSMLVYGMAFDFFNISGSLFVNKETDLSIRSSAQGLFVLMTNGIGATLGNLGAQMVVNHYVDMTSTSPQTEGWSQAWMIFAGYALVVAVLFVIFFKYKHEQTENQATESCKKSN
jgi:NHS family xanthosine MFS transporter